MLDENFSQCKFEHDQRTRASRPLRNAADSTALVRGYMCPLRCCRIVLNSAWALRHGLTAVSIHGARHQRNGWLGLT